MYESTFSDVAARIFCPYCTSSNEDQLFVCCIFHMESEICLFIFVQFHSVCIKLYVLEVFPRSKYYILNEIKSELK